MHAFLLSQANDGSSVTSMRRLARHGETEHLPVDMKLGNAPLQVQYGLAH
jgi:hypothetical protein